MEKVQQIKELILNKLKNLLSTFQALEPKKKGAVIAALVAFFILVFGTTYYFVCVRPGLQALKLVESVEDLEDYDFNYVLSHETKQGTFSWSVNGTYLGSAKQAEFFISNSQGDTPSNDVAIVIDGNDMFVNTRDLLVATGQYWLGDLNSQEYFDEMYSDIFTADVTRIDMQTYACTMWEDNMMPWLQTLQIDTRNLVNEAVARISDGLQYSSQDGSYVATLSTDKLVTAIEGWREYVENNASFLYDDMVVSLSNYSNELRQYNAQFSQSFGQWADDLVLTLNENKESVLSAFLENVTGSLDDFVSKVEASGAVLEHRVTQKNSNVVEVFTIVCGEETYTLTMEKRPSFHTSLEDIPTEYEDLPVQISLLENAYNKVLDTDVAIRQELANNLGENQSAESNQ